MEDIIFCVIVGVFMFILDTIMGYARGVTTAMEAASKYMDEYHEMVKATIDRIGSKIQ